VRRLVAFSALGALLLIAVVAALALGSVRLSPGEVFNALLRPEEASERALDIVRKVRLQRTIAAGLSGAALGLCGTQMQTIFRNPLADPFVLGISSGASFGVALVVLVAGTGSSQWIGGLGVAGKLGISGAAFAGAMAVTLVALAVARRVRGTAAILVVGLMIGYLLAALVSVIVAGADPARLRQFVTWGFGSFRGITTAELRVMAPILIAGIAASLLTTKTLNALLLGERYAESMGVAVRRDRMLILLVTSALAGVVTAFAGPVAFIGVAAPHVARPLVATSDHRVLLPAAALVGAVMTLVAEVVAQTPGGSGVLPLNAVTALLGVPVVIWVLVRGGRREVIT
jgi:cobalamin transport system permease protein